MLKYPRRASLPPNKHFYYGKHMAGNQIQIQSLCHVFPAFQVLSPEPERSHRRINFLQRGGKKT